MREYCTRRSILLCSCLLGLVTLVSSRCGRTEHKLDSGRELKQTSDGCEIEKGFDYSSENPLNNGASTIVASPKECCDLCGTTKGCEKWVMIRAETKNHKKGECWLTDGKAKKVACFVCAAGNKPKVVEKATEVVDGAEDEDECLMFPGLDFKLGDVAPGVPTKNDDECCSLCKSLSSCKAWSRVRSSGKCFMKNVQNDFSLCAKCSASGVIQSRLSSADKDKVKSLLELVKEELNKDDEPPPESRLEDAVQGFLNSVEG